MILLLKAALFPLFIAAASHYSLGVVNVGASPIDSTVLHDRPPARLFLGYTYVGKVSIYMTFTLYLTTAYRRNLSNGFAKMAHTGCLITQPSIQGREEYLKWGYLPLNFI